MNRAVQLISENIGIQHALAEYKNSQYIPAPDYLVVSFPVLSDEKVSAEVYQETLEEAFENVERSIPMTTDTSIGCPCRKKTFWKRLKSVRIMRCSTSGLTILPSGD